MHQTSTEESSFPRNGYDKLRTMDDSPQLSRVPKHVTSAHVSSHQRTSTHVNAPSTHRHARHVTSRQFGTPLVEFAERANKPNAVTFHNDKMCGMPQMQRGCHKHLSSAHLAYLCPVVFLNVSSHFLHTSSHSSCPSFSTNAVPFQLLRPPSLQQDPSRGKTNRYSALASTTRLPRLGDRDSAACSDPFTLWTPQAHSDGYCGPGMRRAPGRNRLDARSGETGPLTAPAGMPAGQARLIQRGTVGELRCVGCIVVF